jgi:hypothetical protein
MNPFLIKTVEACSFSQPVQKKFELKSLIIKEGVNTLTCSGYTTISPFLVVIIIGIIVYFLVKKLKTVQKKSMRIFGWIFVVLLILIALTSPLLVTILTTGII